MHVFDLLSLKGKVALITGGYGLYGSQLTEALAEAGATVITASRSIEKNEAYASELRQKGLEVYGEEYDQASEESILALKDRLLERFGKIDILVNNSVLRCVKDFNGDAADFARSLEVNGTGLFLISRAFGNHMMENASGSIINIGSYMGSLGVNDTLYEGSPEITSRRVPDYYFHKGGMHNLTRFLAGYYGPYGVRCNCLALGGLFSNQPEPFIEEYKKATFLGRMADVDDIKGMIVYLASDASKYTTGTVIPIDGGYSAK